MPTPRSQGTGGYFCGFGADAANYVGIQDSGATAGEARIVLRVNDTQVIGSGVSFTLDTYAHFYAEVTQSDIILFKNGTQVASDSHGLDISQIGSGAYKTGQLSEASTSWSCRKVL